jgi:hypothetical protein
MSTHQTPTRQRGSAFRVVQPTATPPVRCIIVSHTAHFALCGFACAFCANLFNCECATLRTCGGRALSLRNSFAFLCSLHCQLGRGTQPLGTCGPREPASRLAEHCLTLQRSKRKQACLGLPVWAGSSRMTSEASKQPTQKVRHCTVAGCVRHCTVARCVRHCTVARCVRHCTVARCVRHCTVARCVRHCAVARCVRHCTVARCVRHCTVAGCVRHCTVAAYVVICVPRQLLTCARFSCDLLLGTSPSFPYVGADDGLLCITDPA